MKTSIATVSISGDLGEKLAAIAAAGFYGVEIFENDLLVYDETPRTVGRMVRDAGLVLTLFQPFRDFEGMPAPLRQRAFDRAERKFDIMQELGTDMMLVCSSVSPAALGGIDRIAADFAELGERAARRNLRVGYEALAWGRYVSDHRDAWEAVRRADHPAVGLILDSFHTLTRNIDVASIRSIPADRIFIVQLADAPRLNVDLLYLSRHFRSMPGEGDLPVGEFMRAIAATGYDGVISLEIFNDQFRAAANRPVARDGQRSLINLMDSVHRLEPEAPMQVPALPAPIAVQGVEFIEFAADETAGAHLDRLLRQLGFRHTGRHRHKHVDRFTQGGINIVINRETTGLAHASYITRGLSAYAMGLKVDDVEAAMARATALGAEAFTQPGGTGQLQVPAVRGVGGGLVYLVDDQPGLARLWEVEFESRDDAAPTAGLKSIDHVAQTMAYDEMPTWLLFYTSIFAAQKSGMLDIADPSGIVHSQVVENPNRTLRITMNGAENRSTVAGYFVAEAFGAGIQHVAFATDDIFATAAALRTAGLAPLGISANYYADVEARFGLDPAFVERLRDNQVLYDRDEDGEYLQLYSPIISDAFFFEIVERRGYQGYGAANAIFRIAAQRRLLRPPSLPRDANPR